MLRSERSSGISNDLVPDWHDFQNEKNELLISCTSAISDSPNLDYASIYRSYVRWLRVPSLDQYVRLDAGSREHRPRPDRSRSAVVHCDRSDFQTGTHR